MSDIFQEVDEEVRREQLKKLWERYQYLIVAVVVAGPRWRRRLARLRVVAGQEGRRSRRRLRGRGRRWARRASTPKPRRPSPRSRPTAPPAIAVSRGCAQAAELAAERPEGGDGGLREDRRRQLGRAGAAGPRRHCAPASLLIDQGAYDIARARLEPLPGRGPRLPSHRARIARACAPGAPAMRPRRKRWFDMILTDAQTPAVDPRPRRDADRAGAASKARAEGRSDEPRYAYRSSSRRHWRCRWPAAAACRACRI